MVTKPTHPQTNAGEGGRAGKPPRSRYDSWEDDSDEEEDEDWDADPRPNAPSTLHVGGFRSSQEVLPESLRVGSADHTPRASAEMQTPSNTGPWQATKNDTARNTMFDGRESSANPWEDTGKQIHPPPPPSGRPPPIPQEHPPVQLFDNLSVKDHSTNPWGEPLEASTPVRQPSKIEREQEANKAWVSVPPPLRAAPMMPPQTPAHLAPQRGASPEWDEVEPPLLDDMPANIPPVTLEQAQWDEGEKQRQADRAVIPPQASSSNLQADNGWDTQGFESPVDLHAQESGIVQRGSVQNGTVQIHEGIPEYQPPLPARPAEQLPNLPPRPSENSPQYPPRPTYQNANQSTTSVTTPDSSSATKNQKKETYEIKKVTWHDSNALSNPRISPILVQNVNGPCPLLALVNALTLSTPAELNSPLVESLRSREQISLYLLLEGVIDELLSGRRGDDSPDIMALHHFLLDLHTGMNVNPRFFPPPATNSPVDPRRSMTHVHPIDREAAIPGTFEETKETVLYSAFGIPLIHGWLPDRDSLAYKALSRSAPSYEDAENIQFRQEELEEKLSLEGSLSFEEQGVLEDIGEIKAFLFESATQLTSHGIDVIQRSMMPGSFAVMFRNNHFSTLYRHPETYQLFQLVTDMGYAGHDEVVWESLADVNGENCEFFSGDFRLVGGAQGDLRQSEGEWETIPESRNQGQSSSSQSTTGNNVITRASQDISRFLQPLPLTPRPQPHNEQEDADLALAMQLQEEEEQEQRNAQVQRRREAELSQQYIEQEGAVVSTPTAAVNIPVNIRGGATRRPSRTTPSRGAPGMEVRPLVPPRRANLSSAIAASAPVADPEAGIDAPPPSYELAATQPAYEPDPNHPSHPTATVGPGGVISGNSSPTFTGPALNRLPRRQSAYAANSSGQPGGVYGVRSGPYGESRPGPGGGPGRRQSGNGSLGGGSSQQQQTERERERERDCIVM